MGKPVEFQKFGGLLPRQNPSLLPINNPVVALDCVMWHTDMRAIHAGVQAAVSGKVGVIETIYRMGATLTDDSLYWLTWTSDVDVARGAIAGDTTERTYLTGIPGKVPQQTNITLATQGGGTSMPNASYDLGVLQPANAPVASPGSGGSSTTTEVRTYVYTYVDSFGEEGPPSDASNLVTCKVDDTITLSALTTPPGGNYNYTAKRIYRNVVTSDGTGDFEFLVDIPLAQTTYTDSALSQDLGEVLQTTTYFPPPTDMRGIIAMPNGMMAGFSGYGVWFCEPYLPYAWPLGYQQTVNYPVVGLGVFDQTLVVLTTGQPYVMTGVSPSGMSSAKADFHQSCVSKRSIAMTDQGVIWASNEGLCYMGSDGAKLLTEELFAKEDWLLINPSSMVGAYYNGHYIFTTTTGTYIFTPQTMELSKLSDTPTAMFLDPTNNQLYFCIGNSIQRFNTAAGGLKTFTWRSKPISLTNVISPSCARIEADAFPVTFNTYVDGATTPSYSVVVNDARTFRLPSGFRPSDFTVEIVSSQPVRWFAFAWDPKDLALD